MFASFRILCIFPCAFLGTMILPFAPVTDSFGMNQIQRRNRTFNTITQVTHVSSSQLKGSATHKDYGSDRDDDRKELAEKFKGKGVCDIINHMETVRKHPKVLTIKEHLENPPSPFQALLLDSDSGTLYDMLKETSTDGKVPAVTSVAVVDDVHDFEDSDICQKFNSIQLLMSFVSTYATKRTYDQNGGKAYNIDNPKEALLLNARTAVNMNLVLTKSLAGYLDLGKMSTYTFNKSVTNLSINTDLIKTLFGSLGLLPKQLDELKGVLKQITGNLNVSIQNANQDIKHTILYYYFEDVPGVKGLKTVKMRFYYLTIDQATFNAKVCTSSVERVNFKMEQVDIETEMNVEMVTKDSAKIQALVESLCKKNLDDINKAVSPKLITS